MFLGNGSVQKNELIQQKNDKYEICSSEQELFRYFDNGGINGGRTTRDLCKSADLTKKHEKCLLLLLQVVLSLENIMLMFF